MDTKFQVSILQEHSQHIRKLSIKLEEVLQKFEQAVSEPDSPFAADTPGLLREMANLNNSLFAAADIFYKRLSKFVETRKIGSSSTLGN